MFDTPNISPTLRLTNWIFLTLFFAIALGGYLGQTEIVARGSGRVVAVGRTQTIQPQFDGTIVEILAREGATAKKGELLVKLDATQVNADSMRHSVNLERTKSQLAIHLAILASLNDADPNDANFVSLGETALDKTLAPASPSSETSNYLKDSLKSYAASAAVFVAKDQQLQSSIQTAQTMLSKAKQDRDLLQERIAKKGGFNELGFLEIKKEVATADQYVLIAQNQLQELNSQLKTNAKSRDSYLASLRAEQQQKASDLRNEIALSSTALEAARNRQASTSIVSPVLGRVENLQVFTVGAFVQAGQTLMSLVPETEGLEIEALFENRDVGLLAAGQVVFVKLDAYPAERFGIMKGRVLSVGADARKNEDNKTWVYSTRIKLGQNFVEREGKRYTILPGMTGTMDVVTGNRRLISYFFEPLIKTIQDGFGEQ